MASFCTMTSVFRTLDGSPLPFLPVQFGLFPRSVGAFHPTTLVLEPTVRTMSDLAGNVSVQLPQGARVQVYFPSLRVARNFTVPDSAQGDLLAFAWPYPVELEWNVTDLDGEEVDPSLLSTAQDYLVGYLAVMSDTTRRPVPLPRILFDGVEEDGGSACMRRVRRSSPGTATASSDEGVTSTDSTLWSRLGLTGADYAYFLSADEFEVTLPSDLDLVFA